MPFTPSARITATTAIATLALGIAALSTSSLSTAAIDPVIHFDGFDECDRIEADIGPKGGVLQLCGAVLTVPAGAVSTSTRFGIEPVPLAIESPHDMEPAGIAFHFSTTATQLDSAVSVRVPRDDGRRGGLAVLNPESDAMLLIEACQISANGVQQFVHTLGTFGAIRYQGTIPDSTQGLGDGWIHSTTQGTDVSFDLDAPGNNWAIYSNLPDGGRLVTVSAMLELPDFEFEYVRLDFYVNADQASGEIVQISRLGSLSGSFIEGITGTASIDFTPSSDGRIEAEITASLQNGPNAVPFSASLDIAAERYYFAPSLSCPGGGMPPG